MGIHGFMWYGYPKLMEKKTSSLCGYSILLNRSHPWERQTLFSFLPQSWFRGTWPYCKETGLGQPISNFQDDGRKSNQTNQTRIFFSKSGGAFFWFTDFKSSEDSPRLGYPIKMPLSLRWKNHRLLDSNLHICYTWWFQPISKNIVKLDHSITQFSRKIK